MIQATVTNDDGDSMSISQVAEDLVFIIRTGEEEIEFSVTPREWDRLRHLFGQ